MNPRTHRAAQMMQEPSYAAQTGRGEFRVQSQTDPAKSYTVRETASGLVCDCPDHQYRKADCKHIKVVFEVIQKNKGYKNETFRIMRCDPQLRIEPSMPIILQICVPKHATFV